jgi:4-hydroxy-tetrahydrodipicolinate reductase
MSLRIAVLGANGRMGRAVCAAVTAAPDLELVAEYDAGDELDLTGVDVAVDFSVPAATVGNVLACVGAGVHAVVGTTGWDDAALAQVQTALTARSSGAGAATVGPSVGVLIAPNFALGAILALRFAQQAARFYESVEVIELHHPDKVDAPSGTALRTAALIAQARQDAGLGPIPDATTSDPLSARGADVDGIRVHAVRLRGLVAHEEILFGGPGEQLSIRHDSFDRISFMPGVLAGIRAVSAHPGLTVGLEHVLSFDA